MTTENMAQQEVNQENLLDNYMGRITLAIGSGTVRWELRSILDEVADKAFNDGFDGGWESMAFSIQTPSFHVGTKRKVRKITRAGKKGYGKRKTRKSKR